MAQSETTNRELEIAIVRIEGKLDLMNVTMLAFGEDVSTVKKALYGNGKVGLIDDHKDLKRCFEQHIEEQTVVREAFKERRKNFSSKTWAVYLIIIAQLIALIFLYLRPPI